MRRNIFEILAEKQDIKATLNKIENLLQESSIDGEPLEEVVDRECFKEWKARGRYISCEEIRKKLNVEALTVKYEELNEERILLYLEYLCNIIWLCNNRCLVYEFEKEYEYLQENVEGLINDLGFCLQIFEEEEKVLLVEKDAAAIAVAEVCPAELAYDIIEYNHFLLKGDITKKKKILKMLADKIEPMRAELKKINKELESNVGYLLNKMNIRHNNIEGKNAIEYVKNLSEGELKDWYDEIYQMLLLCILEYENIKRNEKVSELKKLIEG